MNNLLKQVVLFGRYFNVFGYSGFLFVFKRLFSHNRNILFSHRKYLYPIILRNGTSDIPTFHQVILYQDYDIDFGFDPQVIIDCGANIGLATVYFKNRFPSAKIISIEPEQSNFEILEKNTRDYNAVYCLNKGIWNKHANLLIKDIGYGNWGFMVEEVEKGFSGSVSAITIDEIMEKFDIDHIDILKIDIEGSEKELFESNFEEWLPKTKVLIIELHDRLREGASKSFFKALCNYDFSIIHKGENIICFMK